jgi:EAL domain-containing protein (putative c-di-GMP-specific phosphodiesterase class I)
MMLQHDSSASVVLSPTGIWMIQEEASSDRPGSSWAVTSSPFRIGRSPDNDLTIRSLMVSGQHAELLEVGGWLFVRDLGSTNGTFLNGQRVTSATVLQNGDQLRFADSGFRVLPAPAELAFREASPAFRLPPPPAAESENAGSRSLQRVLADRNLLPCFQGIHSVETCAVLGFEYLVRCTYPGIESPAELFREAQTQGRIADVSSLCRLKAMEFSYALEPGVPVFLNAHPTEALLDAVAPQMAELRNEHPDRVMVLEIDESYVTDPNLVRCLRRRLSNLGVGLAYDDMGKTQGRLQQLLKAPLDYIKFDSRVIRSLQQPTGEQFRFFRSMIRGLKVEGATTIAEGVETEAMAQVCRDIGFDLVQGFHFSRPALVISP